MSLAVKFPFTIQSGSVAVTDNPTEAVGSMIVFCLGTMIGERDIIRTLKNESAGTHKK
jgi:hypothetical protein